MCIQECKCLLVLWKWKCRPLKRGKKIEENKGLLIYNLGTGKGTSVLELVHAFEKANSIKIKYQIAPRRPGDIASCYANADKAYKEMGFKCTRTIEDACRDSWNWQKNNPKGFDK